MDLNTGRDIDRNSLYFVAGCTKARDWGMVTFNRSPPWEEAVLSLGSRRIQMIRVIFGKGRVAVEWKHCTSFVKGYKIAFSEEAWTLILAQSIAPVNTGQSMNGSTSEIDTGIGQTSGGSQAPSSGNAIYNTSNCNRMNLLNSFRHTIRSGILIKQTPTVSVAKAVSFMPALPSFGYNQQSNWGELVFLNIGYRSSDYFADLDFQSRDGYCSRWWLVRAN